MSLLSQKEILQEHSGLLTGRWLTDLANTSAVIFQHIRDINWVGFYLSDFTNPAEPTLWLGPFQGLPACTMIPFSKGVCGTSAREKKSLVVEDVDQFPGHIVCDSRSKSEIVIPLIIKNRVIGVLDVDSATLGRFSKVDQNFFELLVTQLIAANPTAGQKS